MTVSSLAPAPTRRPRTAPGGPDRKSSSAPTSSVVGGASVSEQGERVVLEFPAGAGQVGLAAQLVHEAFGHPAVRADRPILVCLPRGDSHVLAEVRPHVHAARTRVAGVTCLVEGRVRALPARR